MSIFTFLNKGSSLLLLFCIVILFSCKKENKKLGEQVNNGVSVLLPDSTMFVGTSTFGSTIVYVLDASTGSLVKKYEHPSGTGYSWCVPYAGNGFLYTAENNKINALNINTGAVLWTDSLKSYSSYRPILHNETFYGIYESSPNSGYVVYALDATKKTEKILWQYSLGNTPGIFLEGAYINYYKETIYISKTSSLIALDAKTGQLKWSINSPYSLSSLNNGIIISGNSLIDATTGTQTGAVPPSLLISNTTQTAFLLYATKDLFFTRVVKFPTISSSTSQLNAYDTVTGSLKWSINGGNYNYSRDTAKTVDQIWNNQPIIKTTFSTSVGVYGSVYTLNYSGYDINTGQLNWTYSAGYKGQSFSVNNTQYSNGTFTLNMAAGQPASTSIVAADLKTGKIKWSNSSLDVVNGGTNALCLYIANTGYSPYIQ